ncbi:major facilitator superfamily domain-containing protein [Polychytrium aggregatum]|uniref:major facilitator superfamily domain-containing protein n=1 Tax=Polychytrium aggregatum TaxID=110093 RepID=UPI0022FEF4C2|nr:major facilitator superfamily domain-containing protein [Polychytrium aggregatum]KAI9203730.1 major facilitator superfamily domain-containing protein [Polychytrium aggregatum]
MPLLDTSVEPPNLFPTGFPIRQSLLVLLNILPEVMIHHMLVPLFPFMTMTLMSRSDDIAGVSAAKSNYAYYAGLLQSAYFFPSIFMTVVWGCISDRAGRKPVLLCGVVGYGLGAMLLGMSTDYGVAMLALIVCGLFAANAAVAKCMMGELSLTDEARAFGYSVYGVAYGAAGIVGSALGGLLGDPALFAGSSFLQQRPYFAACALGVVLAVAAASSNCLFLKETINATWTYDSAVPSTQEALQRRPASSSLVVFDGDAASENGLGCSCKSHGRVQLPIPTPIPVPVPTAVPGGNGCRSLKNTIKFVVLRLIRVARRLSMVIGSLLASRPGAIVGPTVPVILYATYALCNSIYGTSLPVLIAAAPHQGGFGLGPREAGVAMTTLGIAKLCAKLFFYPLQRRFGTLSVYQIGCALLVPAALIPPLFGSSSLWPSLLVSAVLIGIGEGLLYVSAIVMVTHFARPEHLGAVHGVAGCLVSLARTLGPYVAGLAWQRSALSGQTWIVFTLVSLSAFAGLVLVRKIDTKASDAGTTDTKAFDI